MPTCPRATSTLPDGKTAAEFEVYQRRGRVIVVLSDSDIAVLRPLAAVVAARLAALSTAEAGE